MKIITCASYYGCGSSAVTDMLSEFSGVKSLTNYEFRFIHDLDGISDLEYQLVQCPNRHNSGHALKRFEKISRFYAGTWFNKRYEPFFNNQYMALTTDYINSLIDFKHKGFWFFDMYDRGPKLYYLYSLLIKLYKKFPIKILKPFPNEYTYFSHPSLDSFLIKTREYIHKLLESANVEREPYVMVDQIVPSSNISRCLRYFSDPIFVFVVDRDPRDIYVSEKLFWREGVAPTESPEAFCHWYRYARECASKESDNDPNIVRLQFEEMVYRYEDMKCEIIEKIGLTEEQHIKPFLKFNPKRSVHNTQLWMNRPELVNEIKVIEELLPEYLFDFSKVEDICLAGIQPVENNVF